jgi:hypothetical protein
MNDGRPLKVKARIRNEWLLLRTSARRYPLRSPLRFLLANGKVRGLGKAVISERGRSVHLRAEIPLDPDVSLGVLLRETGEGFGAYRRALASARGSNALASGGGKAEGTQTTAHSLLSAAGANGCDSGCRDGSSPTKHLQASGWITHQRPNGRAVVDLDVAAGTSRAVLYPESGRSTLVRADFADLRGFDGVASEAIALLLLKAAGEVRFARPIMERRNGAWAASYEVRLGGSPSSSDIEHALKALSIAARMCAEEVRILRDKRIACAYTRLCGWRH